MVGMLNVSFTDKSGALQSHTLGINDNYANLESLTGKKTWGVIPSLFVTVRTNCPKSFAIDFFLPTTLNRARHVENSTHRIFAILGALALDGLTFPIRVITLVPRLIHNSNQNKELKKDLVLLNPSIDFSQIEHMHVHLQTDEVNISGDLNFISVPYYKGYKPVTIVAKKDVEEVKNFFRDLGALVEPDDQLRDVINQLVELSIKCCDETPKVAISQKCSITNKLITKENAGFLPEEGRIYDFRAIHNHYVGNKTSPTDFVECQIAPVKLTTLADKCPITGKPFLQPYYCMELNATFEKEAFENMTWWIARVRDQQPEEYAKMVELLPEKFTLYPLLTLFSEHKEVVKPTDKNPIVIKMPKVM